MFWKKKIKEEIGVEPLKTVVVPDNAELDKYKRITDRLSEPLKQRDLLILKCVAYIDKICFDFGGGNGRHYKEGKYNIQVNSSYGLGERYSINIDGKIMIVDDFLCNTTTNTESLSYKMFSRKNNYYCTHKYSSEDIEAITKDEFFMDFKHTCTSSDKDLAKFHKKLNHLCVKLENKLANDINNQNKIT